MKHITFALGILAAAAAFSISMSAQAGRDTTAGVYSAEQAKRGQMVYNEQCSFCHGDDLKGSDVIPALTGEAFSKTYANKPVADLHVKISSSMPATSPGSLTPEQTSDVIAYMFSVYKLPAGATELPAKADELKTINFVVTP
jgi:mono/diheme cytochrome c family protein